MVSRRRDDRTPDMFEVPQARASSPNSYDFRDEIAELLAQILREAEGDRFDIAARISRLTGKEVSKWMLDSYTSPAREEFNVPFWLVAAIESACDTYLLTNWLASVRGGRLLIGRQALDAELGKLQRVRDEASKKIRELRRQMGDEE